MKLAPQRLAAWLQNPGDCRVVLLYGEDGGMIRNRAEAVTRAVAGSLNDPFRVVELLRDGMDRLPAEAASLPMTGGRKVVRVRETTDAASGLIETVLRSGTPALVVLEGAGMPSQSRLRTLLEAAPDGVAIGCYPEAGRSLEETIRTTLKAAGVEVDRDGLAWLASQLGADQGSTQAELEKLALYVGPGGLADLDAAKNCVGDAAGLSLDDALFATSAGDAQMADRALELALAQGATPVGALRGGLIHLQRLYQARLAVDGGASAEQATRSLRPPVFFARMPAFKKALELWSLGALAAAMAELGTAERNCKRTGAPDQTLCRHALLQVARRANRAG